MGHLISLAKAVRRPKETMSAEPIAPAPRATIKGSDTTPAIRHVPTNVEGRSRSNGAVERNPCCDRVTEARHDSLVQVMAAVWEKAFDRIIAKWPMGFVSTHDIRIAELEVERVQALCLSGKAKLADFQKVTEVWEQVATNAIKCSTK